MLQIVGSALGHSQQEGCSPMGQLFRWLQRDGVFCFSKASVLGKCAAIGAVRVRVVGTKLDGRCCSESGHGLLDTESMCICF